jgi:hypothetical protein
MEDRKDTLAQSPQRLATNRLVLCPQNRGRAAESGRQHMENLSLGTLKPASPSNFGYKFPSSIASFLPRPHNVLRVFDATQAALELSAYAHVRGMGPND